MRCVFKSLLAKLLITSRYLLVEVINELFLQGNPINTRIDIFLDGFPLHLYLFVHLPKLVDRLILFQLVADVVVTVGVLVADDLILCVLPELGNIVCDRV
jgi:hypothetical protein